MNACGCTANKRQDKLLPVTRFDCLVIGSGIIGLAHALAAVRNGLSVAVIERDARPVGASIRNFGFITVTGQQEGATWRRAMRSRDVWEQVAKDAGIPILQRGLLMCARRPEAFTVLQEFVATEMGQSCRLLAAAELAQSYPTLRPGLVGALYSPHERRVESRTAIPRLADWLRDARGVTFIQATATGIDPPQVHTSAGSFSAPNIIVCPGPDLITLFPEIMRRREITLCKLHMMRLASPGFTLPAPIMSDLGLVRYLGYAAAPSLAALQQRLRHEQPGALAHGVHLIAVQGADGTLVVGDSHEYGPAHDPFQPQAIDDLILEELTATVALNTPQVIERWTGIYPSGPQTAFTEAPAPGLRLVMVTSGTGASTAFAIAEETLADLMSN